MVKIITLAYNRPDFIELQLNTLKKWVKDFEYTIFDNAPDDSIKDECGRLGVKCIPIKVFSDDPSWAVGLSLDKMWETVQQWKGDVWYIDHDMFLIAELPKLDSTQFPQRECDMAFVPQYKGEWYYPWTGLMYFNMDKLKNPEELKWAVDYRLTDTDVGGQNSFYLEEYKPKCKFFKMWTIIDENRFSEDGVDCDYNAQYHGKLGVIADTYFFPKPYSFDVFEFNNKPFIFHFKSASNYPFFYTPKYVQEKTLALKKYLCQ